MKDLSRTTLAVVVLVAALVGVTSMAVAEEEADEPEVVEEETSTDDEESVADDETADGDDEAPEAGEESEVAEETPDEEEVEEVAEGDDEVPEVEEESELAEETPDEEEEVEEVADEADAIDEEPDEQPESLDEQPEVDEDWDDVDEDPTDEGIDVETTDDDVMDDVDEAPEVADDADQEADDEDEEPFSPSFGFGVETGYFFSDLARFNTYILEANDEATFDVLGTQHIDLAAESEVLENLRISILGGATFAWQTDPSLFGWYVGLEPAYVVGDEEWGLAIGLSGAIGGLRISVGDDAEAAMSVALLRPFVEARRYFTESTAGYLRLGFNQWYPNNIRSETLDLESDRGDAPLETVDLATGGVYVAAGARFGALQGLEEPEELEPTATDAATDDDE